MTTTPQPCRPHGGEGPACIRSRGHEGVHLFKCAGRCCEGVPWPASVMTHPRTCWIKEESPNDQG